MERTPLQLAFDFVDSPQPADLFYATRPLRKHRLCNHIMKRARYVRRFFPELGNRQIRVGLTRAASGMAVPGGNEVWFNPNLASHHTVAHEFVHLLQGSGGVPGGERSCDVYSLARHWTLNDTMPYYVRIPRTMMDRQARIKPVYARMIYEVASAAIQFRGAGMRNYIKYFERTLRERTLDPRGEPGARRPTSRCA